MASDATPKPTRITWCVGCGRAGERKPGDLLDEVCRYCGGDVRTKMFPVRKAARREVARLKRQRAAGDG